MNVLSTSFPFSLMDKTILKALNFQANGRGIDSQQKLATVSYRLFMRHEDVHKCMCLNMLHSGI